MKTKVDYYRINKFDASELLEAYQDSDDALGAAIDTCRERARLYCIPCDWSAEWCTDGSILVKRYRSCRGQGGQGLLVYIIFLALAAIAMALVIDIAMKAGGGQGLMPIIEGLL